MPKASTIAPSSAWRSGRPASVTTIGTVSPHSAEHAEAVQSGHHHVEQHDVDRAVLQDVQGGASVGGGEHVVAGLENRLVDAEHAGIVVHGQDYGADHHRPPDYSKASGPCA